ncbi:exosortase [Polymorphobacter fuscus]|nr:exosortase [Polymorphobacter fuscus]
MALATFQGIARQSWSTEQGAHGPIVLALGVWLMVRSWPAMAAQARPGRPLFGALLLVPALVLYACARVVGSIVIESGALYLVLLATLYLFIGARAMRVGWFPIAYLLFLLPPPGSFVAAATQPLRLQLSELAVWGLSKFDYPVARSGLNIFVDQYRLGVKSACGGLNSMISLTAMGLFYAHLRQHRGFAYNLVFFFGIIAMAILANLVRVALLILITYHLGQAAAEGYLHQFAGLTMFAVAMGGVLLLDEVMSRVWPAPATAAAA